MKHKLKLWLWRLGMINKDDRCPFCKKPLMPHGFETLTTKQTWTCPDDECEFNEKEEKIWHPSTQGTKPAMCRMQGL